MAALANHVIVGKEQWSGAWLLSGTVEGIAVKHPLWMTEVATN